ncbi:MAG: polymorphic toxin-type HINT domain-containing protein [Planctomycetaceae bacterium]
MRTGLWQWQVVERVFSRLHDGLLMGIHAGGEVITATGRHPVWVVRGEALSQRPITEELGDDNLPTRTKGRWVEAQYLEVGDLLLTPHGELRVDDLFREETTAQVFNLQIANVHTYTVGTEGVLVHNASPEGSPGPESCSANCQSVDKSNDSTKLGNNLRSGPDSDISSDEVSDKPQAHHLVQAGGIGACQVNNRQMLFDCCIGLNDAINGVWLPSSCTPNTNATNPKNRTYHNMTFRGKHELYCEWVNDILEDTGGDCEKVKAALKGMRKTLIDGQAPWLVDKTVKPNEAPC